jgi:hypothetical protein
MEKPSSSIRFAGLSTGVRPPVEEQAPRSTNPRNRTILTPRLVARPVAEQIMGPIK